MPGESAVRDAGDECACPPGASRAAQGAAGTDRARNGAKPIPAEPKVRDAGVESVCIDPCAALSLERHNTAIDRPVCPVGEGGLSARCAERLQAVYDRDAAACPTSCCIDPCVALSLEEHDAALTGPVCAVPSVAGLESTCSEALAARFAQHGSPETVALIGAFATVVVPTLLFFALSYKQVGRVVQEAPKAGEILAPQRSEPAGSPWVVRTTPDFEWQPRLLFTCLLLAVAIALVTCALAFGVR